MMRRLLGFEFVRFLLVGLLNTGVSYAVYALFLYLGLTYVLANLMALLLGIVFSFRTQSALVFRRRNPRLIVRFAACWLMIFGLNIGLITLLMRTGLDPYTAGALALLPVTLISYFMQRIFVFGSPQLPGSVKSSC